jgi:hypothetical protein
VKNVWVAARVVYAYASRPRATRDFITLLAKDSFAISTAIFTLPDMTPKRGLQESAERVKISSTPASPKSDVPKDKDFWIARVLEVRASNPQCPCKRDALSTNMERG